MLILADPDIVLPDTAELIWGTVSFLMVILVIAIVVRAVFSTPRGSSSAIRTLEELYARGEISRAEFAERRAVLEGRQRQPGA